MPRTILMLCSSPREKPKTATTSFCPGAKQREDVGLPKNICAHPVIVFSLRAVAFLLLIIGMLNRGWAGLQLSVALYVVIMPLFCVCDM